MDARYLGHDSGVEPYKTGQSNVEPAQQRHHTLNEAIRLLDAPGDVDFECIAQAFAGKNLDPSTRDLACGLASRRIAETLLSGQHSRLKGARALMSALELRQIEAPDDLLERLNRLLPE